MLLARSLSAVTSRRSKKLNAAATDGDLQYRTDSSTQTNASREPRDEYAAIVLSVTDFQASTGTHARDGRRRGGVARVRMHAIGGAASAASPSRAQRCQLHASLPRRPYAIGTPTGIRFFVNASILRISRGTTRLPAKVDLTPGPREPQRDFPRFIDEMRFVAMDALTLI